MGKEIKMVLFLTLTWIAWKFEPIPSSLSIPPRREKHVEGLLKQFPVCVQDLHAVMEPPAETSKCFGYFFSDVASCANIWWQAAAGCPSTPRQAKISATGRSSVAG
mmetsp:Transcript_5107/g.7788  ORF Transcript_5107/g.7788 Transcript_5107/m.7788 type:complete len:106 (+) Transcript_5107:1091-1408(+)